MSSKARDGAEDLSQPAFLYIPGHELPSFTILTGIKREVQRYTK